MKMTFLASGVFWGIVILLIGGSVILKATTGLKIPVVRIVFGLILVYWGVRVIAGGFVNGSKKHDAVFGEAKIATGTPEKKYTTVFGSSRIDLGAVKLDTKPVTVDTDTVFGSTRIVIPKGIPVSVKVDAVFASATLPDGSSVSFGSRVYKSTNYVKDKPALKIKADVVFGELVVKQQE